MNNIDAFNTELNREIYRLQKQADKVADDAASKVKSDFQDSWVSYIPGSSLYADIKAKKESDKVYKKEKSKINLTQLKPFLMQQARKYDMTLYQVTKLARDQLEGTIKQAEIDDLKPNSRIDYLTTAALRGLDILGVHDYFNPERESAEMKGVALEEAEQGNTTKFKPTGLDKALYTGIRIAPDVALLFSGAGLNIVRRGITKSTSSIVKAVFNIEKKTGTKILGEEVHTQLVRELQAVGEGKQASLSKPLIEKIARKTETLGKAEKNSLIKEVENIEEPYSPFSLKEVLHSAGTKLKQTGKYLTSNADLMMPQMARDYALYEVTKPLTQEYLNRRGIVGKDRAIAENAVGFGLTGVMSRLADRATLAGLTKAANYLDRQAVKAAEGGSNSLIKFAKRHDVPNEFNFQNWSPNQQASYYLTQQADKVQNIVSRIGTSGVYTPLRTLNLRTAADNVRSTLRSEMATGALYGVLAGNDHPILGTIATILSPGLLSRGSREFKYLSAINSGGGQSLEGVTRNFKSTNTAYNGFWYNGSRTKRTNGAGANYHNLALKPDEGMQAVAFKANGRLPIFRAEADIVKGSTFNSPWWEHVNPEKYYSYLQLKPYKGTGWAARRSYGDTFKNYMAQSMNEFREIAHKTKMIDFAKIENKVKIPKIDQNGKVLKNKNGTIKMEAASTNVLNRRIKWYNEAVKAGKNPDFEKYFGDILTDTSFDTFLKKNFSYASHSKQNDLLIAKGVNDNKVGYNALGHRESNSGLYINPNTGEVHELGIYHDVGGTGSGGAEVAAMDTLKGYLINKYKESMDLGALALPTGGGFMDIIRTGSGKTSSVNQAAFHNEGLPFIEGLLRQRRKKYHF